MASSLSFTIPCIVSSAPLNQQSHSSAAMTGGQEGHVSVGFSKGSRALVCLKWIQMATKFLNILFLPGVAATHHQFTSHCPAGNKARFCSGVDRGHG